MKLIIILLLLAGITTTLNACGRRGDPEKPQLQQAQ
jgi:Prokaryotic lipoprotein-attachment site